MRDVFVYDQGTGAVQLVSAGLGGEAADGPSGQPVVNADGSARRVRVARDEPRDAGDANLLSDVFVLVPEAGVVRAGVAPGGAEPNGASSDPDLSATGQQLVFASRADNLVPGDTNQAEDVFLRDMVTGRDHARQRRPGRRPRRR